MWNKLYEGVMLSKEPLSYIVFSQKVIDLLLSYRQLNNKDCEAGGLLLGYIRGNHFDVRYITQPQPFDSRGRFNFGRNDSSHLLHLQRLKKLSGSKIAYIGEWHTHPEDNPNPSVSVDIPEWLKISEKRSYPVVFLIIGRNGFYINNSKM